MISRIVTVFKKAKQINGAKCSPEEDSYLHSKLLLKIQCQSYSINNEVYSTSGAIKTGHLYGEKK